MRGLVLVVAVSVAALSGAASAQAPGAYTVEPFTPQQQITINGTGVRLRAEPFTTPQTQVLSSGSTGLPLTVVGIARQGDWNWYQVILRNGQKAFIRSDLTSAPSRGEMLAGSPTAKAPPLAPTTVYAPPASPPPTIPVTTTAQLPPAPNPTPYSPTPIQVQPAPSAATTSLPPLTSPTPTSPAPTSHTPATPTTQSPPQRGGAIWLTPPASPPTNSDSLQSRPPGR